MGVSGCAACSRAPAVRAPGRVSEPRSLWLKQRLCPGPKPSVVLRWETFEDLIGASRSSTRAAPRMKTFWPILYDWPPQSERSMRRRMWAEVSPRSLSAVVEKSADAE
jgi:hypothetical protein